MPINIPPFWAKYEHREDKGSVIVNGWSDRSATEALENAQKRAKKVFDLVMSGKKLGEYDYSTLPIREQILETVTHDGRPVAVISRNRYGAAVLNTEKVLFADVDFKPFSAGGFFKAIALMFNPGKKKELAETQRREEIARVSSWGEKNRDHPFRLYRTFAGMRLLFTGRTYDPKDTATIRVLESLGSDPLYVKLTKNQSCFRARLTAKPWRIGLDRPPAAFPFLNNREGGKYRHWLDEYLEKSARYRCCDIVNEGWHRPADPEIRKIIELHDRLTGVAAKELPLA
ncbi:MAG TPA: hypothetical protein P5077_07885 [bacterium]|nr:hypothetical protein [bacterium]